MTWIALLSYKRSCKTSSVNFKVKNKTFFPTCHGSLWECRLLMEHYIPPGFCEKLVIRERPSVVFQEINYGTNYQLQRVCICHTKYYVSNDQSDSWITKCGKRCCFRLKMIFHIYLQNLLTVLEAVSPVLALQFICVAHIGHKQRNVKHMQQHGISE